MKPGVISALLSAALMLAACEREFDRPPPTPPEIEIDSVDPDAGFEGDVVVICGRNFAQPLANNQVAVGGASAQIVEAPDEALNPGCDQQRLGVRLPDAGVLGPVTLSVSSLQSQTNLEDALVYLGPGHPPGDDLDAAVTIRSAPGAVATVTVPVGEASMDWLALPSTESRLIQLVEADTALPFGFGTCQTPLSVVLDYAAVEPLGPDGWRIDFRAFATAVGLGAGGGLLRPALYSMNATFERAGDEPGSVVSPGLVKIDPLPTYLDPVSGADKELVPWRVWPLCPGPGPQGGCPDLQLVVSDADAPALAVLPAADPQAGYGLAPAAQDWLCFEPRQVADTVRIGDGANDALLVVLSPGEAQAPGSEIWRFDLDPAVAPQRVWPPVVDDPDLQASFCGLGLGAVAVRRLSGPDRQAARIYAADAASSTLVELRYTGGEPTLEPVRFGVLPAPAFALASGRFAYPLEGGGTGAGEYLYAATARGLVVFDISAIPTDDPDGLLDAVEVRALGDDLRGTPQSLVSVPGFDPGDALALPPVPPGGADRLVLADAAGDRWFRFAAGASLQGLQYVPLINALPQVSPSRLVDGFWLADPNASVLRLVDRRTGVQVLQLKPLESESRAGFSSGRLSTTWVAGQEVLVMAMPAEVQPDPDRPLYDRIMLIAPGELPEGEGCVLDPLTIMIDDLDPFHDMVWLVGREAGVQLLRYGQDGQPGELQQIDLDMVASMAQGEAVITRQAIPLPAELQAIRVSPRYQVRAQLLQQNNGLVVDIMDPAIDPDHPRASYELAPELAMFATSLIAIRSGERSAPVYLLAIPLTHLGELLLVAFEPGAAQESDRVRERSIVTGGLPAYVFTSPDERRLYVTHPSEDKISIVDVDCSPLPACAEVVRTVPVSDNPTEVQFDPSGAKAYVNHLFNNVISVFD